MVYPFLKVFVLNFQKLKPEVKGGRDLIFRKVRLAALGCGGLKRERKENNTLIILEIYLLVQIEK